MNRYIPDRKVLAMGISGIAAFLVSLVVPDIPQETVAGAVVGLMALVGYFVPPSVNDIVKRVDVGIIKLAIAAAAVASWGERTLADVQAELQTAIDVELDPPIVPLQPPFVEQPLPADVTALQGA
jgi:hypothetical protein